MFGRLHIASQHTKSFHPRAFSLTELMVVVAIIGILSAIAVPSYMRYIRSARTSEAVSNLAAIQTFQESYFSENDQYVSLDPSPTTIPVGGARVGFDTSQDGWSALGNVIPNGREVFFQYRAAAGRYDNTPTLIWDDGGGAVSSIQAGTSAVCTQVGNSGAIKAGVQPAEFGIGAVANTHFFVATAVANQISGNTICSLFVAVTDRPDITIEQKIE